MKLRDGEGKFLLKKALEPLVPNDILYRPKQGFSIPLSDWTGRTDGPGISSMTPGRARRIGRQRAVRDGKK